MWKKVVPVLVVLSVAINIAFVGIWAVHAVRSAAWRVGEESHNGVWCPLHRRLDVTDDQWREIEPRLVEFQAAAGSVREDVIRYREEMLDLIAATDPDREALRTKQDEILAGQRRMQELMIEHLISQKEILTPAQQRELFEIMRRRSHRAGHGPGRIPMGGGRLLRNTEEIRKGQEP